MKPISKMRRAEVIAALLDVGSVEQGVTARACELMDVPSLRHWLRVIRRVNA